MYQDDSSLAIDLQEGYGNLPVPARLIGPCSQIVVPMKRETVILFFSLCVLANLFANSQTVSRDVPSNTTDSIRYPVADKDHPRQVSDNHTEPQLSNKRQVSDSTNPGSDDSDVEKGGSKKYLPSAYRGKNFEWGTDSYSEERLAEKAEALRKYAIENGYDSTIAFLVDMQVKSGKKRFFVYDLEQMEVINCGLVAHGSGGKSFSYNKVFSNKPGSNCTSLGMYKVGGSYQGKFGQAFRLYGLEASNSNAYKRLVVLHAMDCIPDDDINGILCQTEGCPAVSPAFLTYLQSILEESDIPVLLWIFR